MVGMSRRAQTRGLGGHTAVLGARYGTRCDAHAGAVATDGQQHKPVEAFDATTVRRKLRLRASNQQLVGRLVLRYSVIENDAP